ncbi:MAG TPA: ATP-binding protein [Candidatus Limnocylindrales bacterium]|nr:ATP-binding protein [Candidatus Limnocylindrales bacterium]
MGEKKYKILYVDDELHNLTTFKETFRKEYEVFTALSGDEGLNILRKEKDIALIITDQRMPHMTGVQFLEKTIPEFPDTIRMILTGFTDIEALIDAINTGRVYRYITKPWDENELRITLKRALEAYELSRQNKKLIEDLIRINKELDQKVEERTRELKQANERKDELLGMVAHDLRNSLTVIINFADLLRKSLTGRASQREMRYLDIIYDSCYQALELIKDLLDIHAIESGKLKLTRIKIQLDSLLKENLEKNQYLATNKGIQLLSEIPENLPPVYVDPRRIHEVLDNLISNAIKFSYPESSIKIKAIHRDSQIEVSIQDQGQGIRAEELGTLFTKFGRTTTKPTQGETSTGLGLAIAKKIVELHGGHIWVDSVYEKGSTFTFSLPVAKEEN